MSREFKFRVYSFVSKSFIYFDIYDYPQGIAGGVSEPQQCLGMKDIDGQDIYEGDLVGLSGTIVPDEFDDVVMSVAVVDDVRVVVAALEVLELIEPLWTSDSCFRRRPRFLGSAESPGTNNIKQFFAVIVSFEGKLGLTCVV